MSAIASVLPFECPRGPLSTAAMDAYIAAVDAGIAGEPDPIGVRASTDMPPDYREALAKANDALPVWQPDAEVESADEPAGPDVVDVASSPLQSDDALVWRVACKVGKSCTWCRERQPDRDTAKALGHAHIAEKHPGGVWEFRVQGIRPATAAGPGEVVKDEEITDELRSVLDGIAGMAGMVERLHQVPFDVAPDLDDEVFIQVAACRNALEALCKVHGVATE